MELSRAVEICDAVNRRLFMHGIGNKTLVFRVPSFVSVVFGHVRSVLEKKTRHVNACLVIFFMVMINLC